MKKLTHLQQQLVNVILYKPEDLRRVISEVSNKPYALTYLRYLLPYRIGVEIDLVGLPEELETLLKSRFLTQFTPKSRKCPLIALEVQTGFLTNRRMTHSIELKFSFRHITQLKYVKELLSILEDHTLKTNPDVGFPTNGGLHIHVDAGKETSKKRAGLDNQQKFLNYFRQKVFDLKSSKDEIECDIPAFRHHKTFEYRLGKSTLDYTKIMRWVLCCSNLNRAVRLNSSFNKELTDAILAS